MSDTFDDPPEPVLVNQAGADLYDWIALNRSQGDGVARAGDRWFDDDRRGPAYVADALGELLQAPGDRRGWRCWSRGCAARRYVAVCGAGVLAATGGGG